MSDFLREVSEVPDIGASDVIADDKLGKGGKWKMEARRN